MPLSHFRFPCPFPLLLTPPPIAPPLPTCAVFSVCFFFLETIYFLLGTWLYLWGWISPFTAHRNFPCVVVAHVQEAAAEQALAEKESLQSTLGLKIVSLERQCEVCCAMTVTVVAYPFAWAGCLHKDLSPFVTALCNHPQRNMLAHMKTRTRSRYS